MNFINTLIVINLVVWIPWLWVYKIHPYFVERSIKKQLQAHPEWESINETANLLRLIFNKNNANSISRHERKRLGIKNDEFIYGEINFLSFFRILEKAEPKSGEIFYDLGSGSGKAVFASALFFNLSKACGIELLPALYHLANAKIKKTNELLRSKNLNNAYLSKIASIQFLNEDFHSARFLDADIIFINATCINPANWLALKQRLAKLKVGSRVILSTKKIDDPQFTLLFGKKELMSWGMSSVSIYKKTD